MPTIIERLREMFKPGTVLEIEGAYYSVLEEPEPFWMEKSYGPVSPQASTDWMSLTDDLRTSDNTVLRVFVFGIDNKYAKLYVKTASRDRFRVHATTTAMSFEDSPKGDEALIPFYARFNMEQEIQVYNTSTDYTISGSIAIKGVTLKLAPLGPGAQPQNYIKISITGGVS